MNLPEWSPQGVLHLYWNVHEKVIALLYVSHRDECLIGDRIERIIFVIRRIVLFQECVHAFVFDLLCMCT